LPAAAYLPHHGPPEQKECDMPMTSKGFPVMLTFDLDAETMWTARDARNAERPIVLSQGAYGWKTGVPRILDLLDRYAIKSTFFVPGIVIEQRPAVIEEMMKRGHEIAHHSWSHAWIVNLTPEEEREEMERGFEIINRVTGRPPAGYRSPAGEFSPQTMSLLQEYGFSYSSNFFDTDCPYLHAYEGKITDLVEFPFAWVLDDAPFFQYSITLPGRTMQAPSAVLEAWIGEFDTMYREQGQFMLAMHPQIIGRPSRLAVLEKLIRHIAEHDVWIGRCDEIADAVRPILKQQLAEQSDAA
jgi:peptidoglycan/xylan/chitin deacetylase (PgdA/CDA1 family)